MRLKNFSAFLLLLLGGCSGAEFSEPAMPAPSRHEGPEDELRPRGLAAEEAAHSNQPPVALLRSPEVGARYHLGSAITFEGRGMDPEDGGLAASAFTWWVNVHEGSVVYPFVPPITGMARGTFKVPVTKALATPRWYRIHLEVRDSDGNTSAVFRDVFIDEETEPDGLRAARVR